MVNTIEIPQGYQLTDIGVFPEGWKVISLNETLDLLTDFEANGSFESVAENVNIYDSENYAWFVRATDLEKNSDLNNVKYVDKETYDFLKKTKLYGGEVLITKRGEIGKVYFFQMKTDFATVAPNMYLLKLNDSVVPFYIFSFFKATIGNRLLIEKNASSTLGALYKDDVKSILIPLPTKSEQIVIANALSDTDSLIENLKKLIAKKLNIKQGAMQELLKPREKWELKTYGEVFNFLTTATYSRAELKENQEVGYIHYGDIHTKLNFFLDTETFEFPTVSYQQAKNYHYLRDGDIIIVDASEDYDGVGKSVEVRNIKNKKIISGLHTFLLRDEKKILVDGFKGYLHASSFIKKQFDTLATGLKVYGVSRSNLKKVLIPVPSKEEQQIIANTLIDMDKEIEALEQKLHKYRMIKQGMMQVLLTGKIRLT